jgi:hypothetical protein
MWTREQPRPPSSPRLRPTRNGPGHTATNFRAPEYGMILVLRPRRPEPGRFQGLEHTAGLPLAATMGQLAGRSLCPEGARSEYDAYYIPAPKLYFVTIDSLSCVHSTKY